MPAYVISEVEARDETLFQRYRTLAERSIEAHGGRYLARAALPHAPGDDWPERRRMVIVEFPSMDRLRAWYDSAEYAEARELSRHALARRLLFVDGAGVG